MKTAFWNAQMPRWWIENRLPIQRRAYFKTREIARIFFLKVRDSRPWPSTVTWSEMPVSKGFLVTWFD